MFTRRLLFLGLTMAVALLAGSPAFAAPPAAVAPEVIRGPFGFESSIAPFTAHVGVSPMGDSRAWWGWNKTRYAPGSGTGAVWCAGSSNSAPYAATLYPYATSGWMHLDIPELRDFYSARLSFNYNWPSYTYKISPADMHAFRVMWQELGAVHPVNDIDEGLLPQTTSNSMWTTVTEDLTDNGNSVALSRKGGKLIFDFADAAEDTLPATDTVVAYKDQTLGATVDDVVVRGYTYGPVRDLHAAPSLVNGVYNITLGWSRPASSTTDAQDDIRSKRYRIWREDLSSTPATWLTDVVDTGSGALSYTDRPGSSAKDWKYYIQTVEPAGAPRQHWGERAALLVTKQVVPTTSLAISPASPGASGWYTTPPTITFTSDVSPSTTYYRVDSGSSQPYLQPFRLTDGTHYVYYYSVGSVAGVPAESQKQRGPLRVDTFVPPKPSPSLIKVTETSLTFSWPAVVDPGAVASGVSQYRIYNSSGALVATVPAVSGTVTWPVTGLAPATTYTYRVVAADAAGNTSSPFATAAVVSGRTKNPIPTVVGASVPAARVVPYKGTTPLSVDLFAYPGGVKTPLAGKASLLKVYYSTTGAAPWNPVTVVFTDMGAGHYVGTVTTTTKTWYQVRFVASGAYAASPPSSSTMLIQSRALLSRPTVPKTAYRTRYASIYGSMSPKHNVYHSTRLYFERYEFYRGKYRWRLKFYKYANLSAGSGYEKYAYSLKFPSAGRWRVRAWHGDVSHYYGATPAGSPASSPYGPYSYTITVK